jgi:F-type H+-transporting ATPase subunit delta
MSGLPDSSQIAGRYSAAIFALAVEKHKETEVASCFAALAEAIENDAELARALRNPLISREHKANALLASIKGANAVALNAVNMVALRGRAAYIPAISRALEAKRAARANELHATLVSAKKLPDNALKELQSALSAMTGKTILVDAKQNPAVIGGVSIQIGSLFIDGTLAGQLNRLRHELKHVA